MPTATITRPGQAKEGQPSVSAPIPRTPINVKWSPGTTPLKPLEGTNVIFEGKVKIKSNEGVGLLPPQPAAVGGRLSEFGKGWKRITNDPHVLSIEAKGYRLHFTSPPLLRETPFEIRSPQGRKEILGMQEQISLMLQKNAIRCLQVPQDFTRTYSWYKKRQEGLSYLHYKLSSEYRAKRRLRVQDRPAGCVLSRTNSSKQQEVPQICLQKQGLPVSGTSLPSEHSPSGFQGAGIADRNHNIVLGRLNKYMTDQHPAKPWGPREFSTGSCYYTHNTEVYVPRPESLVIPSRPPSTER